jgi:hypothetical protein
MDFRENGSFELHPTGRPDDCLVNDDHREYIYRNPLCIPSYDVADKLFTSCSSLIRQTQDGARTFEPSAVEQLEAQERACGKCTCQRRRMELMTMTTTLSTMTTQSTMTTSNQALW